MDLLFLDLLGEVLDKLLYQKMFDKKYSRKKRIIYITIFITIVALLFALNVFLGIIFYSKCLILSILFFVLAALLFYWLLKVFLKKK